MNVDLLKLHENVDYVKDCCLLLNDEWPRSETARMHSLCKCSDNLPISFVLIDKQSNRVIGHIRVKKDVGSNSAFIESLVVCKEERGKGYGKYMMNKAEQFIKEMGFTSIKLTTKDKVSFYEKLGYKLTNECNKLNEFTTNVALNNNCNISNCLSVPRPPPPLPPNVHTSNGVNNIYRTSEMQKMLT